jgi:hypothetical protein
LDAHIFNESEMARSSECKEQYAQKVLDTADIVRDAMLRQQQQRPRVPVAEGWAGTVLNLKTVLAQSD